MSLWQTLKKMLWPFGKDIKKWSDKKLQEEYVTAGSRFGSAVSYLYMGQCVGFRDLLHEWAKFEREWALRGYRTFSVETFVELGGYGTPIPKLGEQRDEDEEVILHAEIYRDNYLDKVPPALDLNEVMNGTPVVGTWNPPSTERRGRKRRN